MALTSHIALITDLMITTAWDPSVDLAGSFSKITGSREYNRKLTDTMIMRNFS
jgi:hypothetical protein